MLRDFRIAQLYIYAAIVSSLIWTFCAHRAFYGTAAYSLLSINKVNLVHLLLVFVMLVFLFIHYIRIDGLQFC